MTDTEEEAQPAPQWIRHAIREGWDAYLGEDTDWSSRTTESETARFQAYIRGFFDGVCAADDHWE